MEKGIKKKKKSAELLAFPLCSCFSAVLSQEKSEMGISTFSSDFRKAELLRRRLRR